MILNPTACFPVNEAPRHTSSRMMTRTVFFVDAFVSNLNPPIPMIFAVLASAVAAVIELHASVAAAAVSTARSFFAFAPAAIRDRAT